MLPRLSQSPTDPDFVQNPYPFYDRARAAGPLFHWTDYDLPCTTTYEATNAILRDRRFGRAPLPENAGDPAPHLEPFHATEQFSLLQLAPPQHTRIRGLVLRAFTSRRIDALAPEIEALTNQLIDDFPATPFDVIPAYATPIPVIIIARLLGVPENMAPQLLHWSNTMVAIYQARRSRDIENAASAAAFEFSEFLTEYINSRRSSPRDDLITHLIAAEEAGEKLTTAEMISTCILLLNAGHEATVHTIGNGIKALIEHQVNPADLTETSIQATVEEVMRFDPPLHMFTRYAYETIDLFGHTFQRGDEVGCLLAAANRDPNHNGNAQAFDPARAANPQLALGVGLHFCVGAPLARLELKIALQTLFRRLPNLRIVETPRYANLYHFHGLEKLIVDR